MKYIERLRFRASKTNDGRKYPLEPDGANAVLDTKFTFGQTISGSFIGFVVIFPNFSVRPLNVTDPYFARIFGATFRSWRPWTGGSFAGVDGYGRRDPDVYNTCTAVFVHGVNTGRLIVFRSCGRGGQYSFGYSKSN